MVMQPLIICLRLGLCRRGHGYAAAHNMPAIRVRRAALGFSIRSRDRPGSGIARLVLSRKGW